MRFATLLAVCTFALTATAYAQDIRWKPELARPGDYITIDQSQGGLIHHVFKGKSGRAYILESYRGRTPAGTPVFTTYLDKDGNYLRWVRSDGFEIRYRPHDCTRTIGQCQYREIHSDGKRKSRTRITKATQGGFSFQEFDQGGQFLFGGQMALDERGFSGNGTINGTKGTQKFRVVRRFYQ